MFNFIPFQNHCRAEEYPKSLYFKAPESLSKSDHFWGEGLYHQILKVSFCSICNILVTTWSTPKNITLNYRSTINESAPSQGVHLQARLRLFKNFKRKYRGVQLHLLFSGKIHSSKCSFKTALFPSFNLHILSSKSNLRSSFANMFNFKFSKT